MKRIAEEEKGRGRATKKAVNYEVARHPPRPHGQRKRVRYGDNSRQEEGGINMLKRGEGDWESEEVR